MQSYPSRLFLPALHYRTPQYSKAKTSPKTAKCGISIGHAVVEIICGEMEQNITDYPIMPSRC
jgi:hypothetical protein